MLNILKNLFDSQETEYKNEYNILELLSGLMIEAANTDGEIDDKELERIHSILINSFEQNPEDVKSSIEVALENKNNSKSLHYYTSKLNKELSDEKKILLIETLWEIILSDGNIHDYESNLIRRLSGLLYISDINSGNAKKRALNKLSGK